MNICNLAKKITSKWALELIGRTCNKILLSVLLLRHSAGRCTCSQLCWPNKAEGDEYEL